MNKKKLIYHLKKLDWKVSGCDLNHNSIKISNLNNLETFHCDFKNISLDYKFNVIHFGDVLEHTINPKKILIHASENLYKNGVISIRVPNGNSRFAKSTRFFANLFHFHWIYSQAPYHLYEFSSTSLIRLLQATGFKDIEINYTGSISLLYQIGSTGYFDDLKKKIKLKSSKYKFNFLLIPYIPKLFFISLLVVPFVLFSKILGRDNFITVLAKKK